MNFVVLTAALSGANATLYVASRMIFSLARTGWAPHSLGRLNHEGSPQNALLHSAFGIALALAVIVLAPKNAFRYMLGAAFTGMILSWLVSLLAHISFRRRHSRQELAALPLRSPVGSVGIRPGIPRRSHRAGRNLVASSWSISGAAWPYWPRLRSPIKCSEILVPNGVRGPKRLSPIPPKAFYFHKLAVVS
jgi:hypothetical protein